MKTTVEIADPLLEEAMRETERSNCTLRDLIELGLQRELDRRNTPPSEVARSRPGNSFRLRDASVAGSLQPGMRSDRLEWYVNMGKAGFPDTVEGINNLMDEYDANEARKK